jgi:ribose transport system substrate-binding protein
MTHSLPRRLLGRLASWAAAWSLALLLAACDAPSDQSATAQPQSAAPRLAQRPRIALVMKTLTNPFFIEMEKGARRAEQELNLELLVRTAAQETSIEQQIGIVDQLIRDRVSAIVIAPGDSVEPIPVLKKAQDSGIWVINIDNRLDPELSRKVGLTDVPFVGVDNEAAAYAAVRTVAAGIDRPTQAALIEGIRGAANAEDRKHGALRALAENPLIRVVAQESANWKVDEGRTVARSLLERYPGVQILFCANDMMAIGAMKYLESAGRAEVRVVGYDALEQALAAVRAGRLAATVDQQAAEQGYLGVVYAVRALNGGTPPLETLVPTRVLTAHALAADGSDPAPGVHP